MPPRRATTRGRKTVGTFIVEEIVGKRVTRVRGRNVVEYNVKWLNFPSETNTWEPEENFYNPLMVAEYNKRIGDVAGVAEAAADAAAVAAVAAAAAAAIAVPAGPSSSCASRQKTHSTSGGPSTSSANQEESSVVNDSSGPSTSTSENETLANSGIAEAPIVNDNDRNDGSASTAQSTSSRRSMRSRPALEAGAVIHQGDAAYEVISNQDGVLVGDLTYHGSTVKFAEKW